jgi:hypothetical protein
MDEKKKPAPVLMPMAQFKREEPKKVVTPTPRVPMYVGKAKNGVVIRRKVQA